MVTIPTDATAAMTVSPNGSRIATAGSTSIAQARNQQIESSRAATEAIVWSAKTGKPLMQLAGATSPIHDIAYSADGTRIVTGGNDGTAIVWDAATGKRLFALPDPDTGGGFLGVAFRPDGAMLATADGLGRIRIWNLADRRLVRTIAGRRLCGVAWNRDGTLIGTGQCGPLNFSEVSVSLVWDVETGRLVFKTKGLPTGPVRRFSPDGRDIVTPTESGTAEIWNLRTHRLVATLTGHTGQIDAVAHSPDAPS